LKIKKLSNSSVGVSLNPAFLKVAGLKLGDKVEINAEKDIITIKKHVESEEV